MVKKPRPTRAEGSDVANAILDGADCTMLSGETAKGDYPLMCVKTMASIAREAESCIWNEKFFEDMLQTVRCVLSKSLDHDQCSRHLFLQESKPMDVTHTTAVSAVQASFNLQASAIIAITTSGMTAHLCSKYKPHCPIVAITRYEQIARQMQLYRGIFPLHYEGKSNSVVQHFF